MKKEWLTIDGLTWTDDGKYWVVELPLLDVVTQGLSKDNAYYMLDDCIKCYMDIDRTDIPLEYILEEKDNGIFTIHCQQDSLLFNWVIDRLKQGLK
jgi:predicted RNase H-like HicB family nuclease